MNAIMNIIRLYVITSYRSIEYFWIRRILNRHKFVKLTEHLSKKEVIFKAPVLDSTMLKAIRLVAPHIILKPDEKSRMFWEKIQNATCWGEYAVLHKYLSKIPKPKKILEIGPGMGRSIVFISKKFNWTESEFHLYESEGNRPKYTKNGPMSNDSFCGSIEALERILKFNDIKNYKLFDAQKLNYRLDNLPTQYDVIYCFYGIGWHWSLEHVVDEIFKLMHRGTVAFFLVHHDFKPFKKLYKINFTTEDYIAAYPENRKNKILIMNKSGAV